MKKKALLFGSLPVLAIVSGLFLMNSNDSQGIYQPRNISISNDGNHFKGADEYYHLLKGDFTREQFLRSKQLASDITKNRATISWLDQGPDNIGGRTRAIAIDRNNINHLFAGSVSGGLFESINRASTWEKVESFNENLGVSSICQTPNGTFYVGTGHAQETTGGSQNAYDTGANGFGVFKQESDGSWTQIPGTEDFSYVNEVVADTVHNIVWIACNEGLMKYDGSVLTEVDGGLTSGACTALSISVDGSVIVAAMSGSKTNVSLNGGVSFTDYSSSSNTPNPIGSTGSARVEYAISHEKVDGKYRVYCSAANSFLTGVWRSTDSGVNWSRIAPAYDGVTPGSFSPFSSGGNGQGTYDNIITVVPGAPDKVLLGGIDCYSWSTSGNWTQISQWFLAKHNPKYVHADIHEFVWDKWGRLYIGNDGGVAFSENAGASTPTFAHANRGYNVTQFFASGFSAHGDVIGGSQDNGTSANYHTGTTWKEHKSVGGGDGFSAQISFINRNILFSSVYYSAVRRSSDRGENSSSFVPNLFDAYDCIPGSTGGDGCGQFFTNFELWENPADGASTDSIRFIPQQDYNMGDPVEVPSATSQTTIDYISPIDIVFDDTLFFDPAFTFPDTVVLDAITGLDYNLGLIDYSFIFGGNEISIGDSILITDLNDTIVVESFTETDHYVGTNPAKPGQTIDMKDREYLTNISWDTLIVQDPFQSWFALGNGGDGIWMTRNALRFSASTQGWFEVADIPSSEVSSLEYSKNGDYLFVGTWSGRLYRLTGFNGVYSPIAAETATTSGDGYLVDWKNDTIVTKFEEIGSFGAPVTGIASGIISDPDHLVVTLGNFGGSNKVRESVNATGAAPTFTSLGFPSTGEGLGSATSIPCYAVIIDRNDPNIIVVGTEFGVYATETGGGSPSAWENVSGDFGNSPVFDMGQNWRTWDEGCKRPGEIYIGTHGRGIWSSDAYLSNGESDNLVATKFQPNVKLYPNPVNDQATLEFELENASDATIQIFNLNGQVVREINKQNMMVGKNKVAIDAQDLPKGTYIVRLTAGSTIETTKFIKH